MSGPHVERSANCCATCCAVQAIGSPAALAQGCGTKRHRRRSKLLAPLKLQRSRSFRTPARLSCRAWRNAMLAYHLNSQTGIVELRPRGPLEAQDFASLALTVDAYIEDHGKLRGLLLELDHFPGWDDWEAVAAHLRFVRSHLPKIERVALVTRNPWLEPLPDVLRVLTPLEVRRFAPDQRGEAFVWIAHARPH
jgi:hypothetical protein